MNKWKLGLFAALFVASACDDVKSNGGGAGNGGTSGSGASGGSGGSGGTGGMTVFACPTSEPTMGSACSTPSLHCSYGEGAFPMCRHRYRCDAGVWSTLSAFCEQEPAPCAPSPPDGQACPGQTSYCVDQNRLCMCPVCGGAGCPPEPWSWSCSNPPAMGCPNLVPNEGTACADATLICEYGIMCNEHATARCKNGLWVWDDPVACP